MPAPSPVERSQKVEKWHLDNLATYANEKSKLPGKPYAFPAFSGWKTELDRLRRNLFEQFGNNPAYAAVVNVGQLLPTDYLFLTPQSMLMEQKRLLQNNAGRFISHNGTYFGAAGIRSKRLISDASFYHFYFIDSFHASQSLAVRSLTVAGSTSNVNARNSKDVEFIFPHPGVLEGERSVKTTLHLNKGHWIDGSIQNDEDTGMDGLFRIDQRSFLDWKLLVNVPEGSICRGLCRTPLFTTAPGVTPIITKRGEIGQFINAAQNGNHFILSWEFDWGDRTEFDFGIKIENFDPVVGSPTECHFTKLPQSDDRLVIFDVGNLWSYIEWEFTTEAELADDVIHNTKPCYKVTIPNCSVKHHPDSAGYDAATEWRKLKIAINATVYGYNYSHGNLGRIMHAPSADITDGIYIGKTFPIRSAEMNPVGSSPLLRALNPRAHQAAPQPGTSEVNPVIPGIDNVIPTYPVRHISEPEENLGQFYIAKGAIIFKVAIWRQPVLNGEIWNHNPIVKPVTVNIGFMRDGSFVSLQEVALVGNEVEIYPDWLVFTPDVQLVYQTSSGTKANVHANLIANSSSAGRTTYVIGEFFATEKTVKFPILADHYNDALQALNLIN